MFGVNGVISGLSDTGAGSGDLESFSALMCHELGEASGDAGEWKLIWMSPDVCDDALAAT